MSETREGGQWRGPATLDVETMVWDLPIKVFPTNPLHASSVTLLKTGSSIQVWCHCGVDPLPPTSCQTASQTGSSIQVWCRCGVEPPPPTTHTHKSCQTSSQNGCSSLMSLWSGTSPLSPYIMSDLFTDWLLHPSLMSLWNGTSLHPPHHVRPLHRLAPPSKSDVAVEWNLPPPPTSCQTSSQTGSSIQVWCRCGMEPPPTPHIMSDLFTDWLLHPSLMSLWTGTSPHPPHHVKPLHRMAPQVWCHCGLEPPPTLHIMSSLFTEWLLKSDVTVEWNLPQPPTSCQTSSLLEPPPTLHIMSNLFTEWLLKSDVTVEWNLSPHIMSNLFMNWPLHLKLMSPCAGFHSSLLHNSAITVLKTGSSIQVLCQNGVELTPPPLPPPPPSPTPHHTCMLCHLAKDWYLHASVMSPWWTSFTLRQWLCWRLAPPFQADDADFCGS